MALKYCKNKFIPKQPSKLLTYFLSQSENWERACWNQFWLATALQSAMSTVLHTSYYWLVLALAHDDAVVHTNTAATLLDSLCQAVQKAVQCTLFVFPIFTTISKNFFSSAKALKVFKINLKPLNQNTLVRSNNLVRNLKLEISQFTLVEEAPKIRLIFAWFWVLLLKIRFRASRTNKTKSF